MATARCSRSRPPSRSCSASAAPASQAPSTPPSGTAIELTPITADQLKPHLGHATAVYAFNDEYALNALDALPAGVALIGTDDSPAARLSHPRLTTIALVQNPDWQRLAERLHALIEDEDADASPIVVQPTLVSGATT